MGRLIHTMRASQHNNLRGRMAPIIDLLLFLYDFGWEEQLP